MSQATAERLPPVKRCRQPVVVATADAAAAVSRVTGSLERGSDVTLVVSGHSHGLAAVEVLAALRLTARRTGSRLEVRIEDPALRALLEWAGLSDVVEG